MKITFLTGYRPTGDSPLIPTYKKGETYDFGAADTYARKYIRLGLAEEAKPEPVVAPDRTAEFVQFEAIVGSPGSDTVMTTRTFGKRRS